jgi:hypothetical protein
MDPSPASQQHPQDGHADLTIEQVMEVAMAGGAFDDLAQEPDLYGWADGEDVAAPRPPG